MKQFSSVSSDMENIRNTHPRENTPGKEIVPRQTIGERSGAAHKILCNDVEESTRLFSIAKQRLLDVNSWHLYSGMGSAEFKMFDRSQSPSHDVRIGNFIRIDLPGPGPRSGGGYDWVEIEDMKEEFDPLLDECWFAFRVRPTAGPGSNSNTSSHFYKRQATSTFIVKRMGNHVTTAVAGRNEIPNTESRKLFDRLRNAIVGISASKGLSYPQWKSLMKGIIEHQD